MKILKFTTSGLNNLKNRSKRLFTDKRFSEILNGTVWAMGARIVATCIGIVSSIIIARAYGAEVMGILAILNSFFALATIFTVLGTNTSILRLIPEHLTKYSPTSAFRVYRKTQYLVAGISVITGALLFFASGVISETIFSKPYLRYYFALAAFFVVFKSLMILNTQAVRGLRLIKVFAFMQLLPTFSKLIILVVITLLFYNRDNPVYAFLSSIAVTAIIGIVIMNMAFKRQIRPDDICHAISIKNILFMSLPMLMSATMMFVIGQTGVIILGMFRPDAEVGYYSVAVTLASLTTFVLSSVESMAGPKFSEFYHSDKMDDLLYIAKKSAKLIFWLTLPFLLFLTLMGKVILSLFYGADFTVAYWAMVLLIIGQFINAISGCNGVFMNMTGHQHMLKNFIFLSALINIGLNILLTPKYGMHGAAFAGMVALIFWNIATLIYIKIKFGKTIGYFPFLI